MECIAVSQGISKREGKQSVEFYANYKAQWYCCGVTDSEKGGLFKGCRQCSRFIEKGKEDARRMALDSRYKII
jgi:hypothetical protein